MAKKGKAAEILGAILPLAVGVAGGIKGVKDSPAGASQPGAFMKGMGSAMTGGFKQTPAKSVDQANTQSRAKATLDIAPFSPYLAGDGSNG